MVNWKRAVVWFAAGFAVVAFGMAAGVAGDRVGGLWSSALYGPIFWLGLIAGPLLMVRGALLLMEDLDRTAAVKVVILSFLAIIVAVLAHNAFYAITGIEEAFFFTTALLVGPVVLVAAIIRTFLPAHREPPQSGGTLTPSPH